VSKTWTVRVMKPQHRDAIIELGGARGWTAAETLGHLIQFVQQAQFAADDSADPRSKDALMEHLQESYPDASLLEALLMEHGLTFVKR
jgi:hypothetical protein